MKTRIFAWLVTTNIILTWDNGQKREWQGQNRCTLCNNEEESVNHLFVTCSFAVQVWIEVFQWLNCPASWNLGSLELSMKRWVTNPMLKYFQEIPCYVMWGIWLHRNQTSFKDNSRIPSLVAHKIRVAFEELKRSSLPK